MSEKIGASLIELFGAEKCPGATAYLLRDKSAFEEPNKQDKQVLWANVNGEFFEWDPDRGANGEWRKVTIYYGRAY
jgi:hypothetical protein